MLLFVLATLVVFHFALPEGAGDDAAYGLLWVAIVFTALLGLARAWVPEQEHGVLDGLVLAPCDRSAIWLGKTLATLAFLLAAQVVALPAFVLFFAPLDATAVAGVLLADIGICAVGSLMSAMAAAGRAREVLLPLLLLPLAIPLIVGGVGAAVSPDGERFLLLLALYDAVFAVLSWASFEYVVTEYDLTPVLTPRPSRSRLARRGADGPRARARAPRRPRGRGPGHLAADLLHPRADRAHGLLLLRARRAEGAPPPLARGRAVRPRELRRDPSGHDLRRADADHRLDLGEGVVGRLVDWSSNQLVLFLVLFLFYCAYFMLRFSIEPGPRRERSSAVYALFGVVLIPVSFLAIRLAEDFIHPTVFTRDGPQMTGTMFATFCVSWAAVTLLAFVLYRVELVGKRLDVDLRELREALQ